MWKLMVVNLAVKLFSSAIIIIIPLHIMWNYNYYCWRKQFYSQIYIMWMPSVLWRCWLGGRKGIRPVKTEWSGAGVVIWLERGVDLHIAQLMPVLLTVSCFSKIQIGLPFWYRLTWVVLEKGPLNVYVFFCQLITLANYFKTTVVSWILDVYFV